MISNAIRIVGGLIVVGIIAPKLYGTFTGIGIIMGYLPILQFGVMNGLNRELPYYLGKGEIVKAKEYAAVVQFYELFLSTASFLILTFISIYFFFESQYLYAAAFFTYAISSVHEFIGVHYLRVLFRTNSDFNKLSTITLISTLVSLVGVILVWKWTFYGVCLRVISTVLVELYFLWRWKPFFVFPKWDFDILKEVVKVGFPIFIVGIVSVLWITLQNTFVLRFGGVEQFGFFSLAIMVEGSVGLVAYSIEQVIYPKMSFEYGSGKGVKDLLKLSTKPIFYTFIFLIPSIIIGWVLLPYFVDFVLPKYSEGVDAARWTLLLLLISIFGVNNCIFNVLKKQKDLLISLIIGIIAFLSTLFILYYTKGFSLVFFPQAMIVGKIVQLSIGYFFIFHYLKEERINCGEGQDIKKHKLIEAYLNQVMFKGIRSGKLLAGHLESNSLHKYELSFVCNLKHLIKLAENIFGMFKIREVKSLNSEYILTKLNNNFHFNALMNPIVFHYLKNSAVICDESSFDSEIKITHPILNHSIKVIQTFSNSRKDIGKILKTSFIIFWILFKRRKRLKLSNCEIIIFVNGLILQLRSVSFWHVYFENSVIMPKCIITELDRTTLPSPLILTARKFNVFSITLTHGVISEYGFTPLFADHIFCWGKFQMSQLISLGIEPNRISITGNPMFKDFCPKIGIGNRSTTGKIKVCLAISPEGAKINHLLLDIFIAALEQSTQINGIVKLHPNLKRKSVEWILSVSPNIKIFESSDITNCELFNSIDFLIIRYSGIANEALAAGVPTSILNPKIISGLNILQVELIRNAGCDLATNTKELIEIFKKMSSAPDLYKKNSMAKCSNYLMNLYEFKGEDSVSAMISEIDRLTNDK